MQLSILITATQGEPKWLDQLYATLLGQFKNYNLESEEVEIFVCYDKDKGYGARLNELLKDASGKYVWFLNEKDLVSETAIDDLFSCFAFEPDIITISGMTTFEGRNPCDWTMGIDKDKLPNHYSPMRTDIAKLVPFRKRKHDAASIWAKRMNEISPWVHAIEIEKTNNTH